MCSDALGLDDDYDALEFDELINALYDAWRVAKTTFGDEQKYYVSIFKVEHYANIDKSRTTIRRYVTFRIYVEDGDFLTYYTYEL